MGEERYGQRSIVAYVPSPVHSVPGGWRDWWDDSDEAPRPRALAADERREREARRLRNQGDEVPAVHVGPK